MAQLAARSLRSFAVDSGQWGACGAGLPGEFERFRLSAQAKAKQGHAEADQTGACVERQKAQISAGGAGEGQTGMRVWGDCQCRRRTNRGACLAGGRADGTHLCFHDVAHFMAAFIEFFLRRLPRHRWIEGQEEHSASSTEGF